MIIHKRYCRFFSGHAHIKYWHPHKKAVADNERQRPNSAKNINFHIFFTKHHGENSTQQLPQLNNTVFLSCTNARHRKTFICVIINKVLTINTRDRIVNNSILKCNRCIASQDPQNTINTSISSYIIAQLQAFVKYKDNKKLHKYASTQQQTTATTADKQQQENTHAHAQQCNVSLLA